jgi:hypothetical protein
MKAIIVSLALSFGLLNVAYAEGETKKVCIDVKGKDGNVIKNKDGTNKQQCKEMKIHKKLEGTKVPEKK